MATIPPLRIHTPHDGQLRLYEWVNLTEHDTAEPVLTPDRFSPHHFLGAL